jgi:tetratricopeptide (TPR) repeat protein
VCREIKDTSRTRWFAPGRLDRVFQVASPGQLCYNPAIVDLDLQLEHKQKRAPWWIAIKLAVVGLLVLLANPVPSPHTFPAALRRAETHRTFREYSAALEAYAEAARLNARSPLPWQRSGEVLLAQHRFPEATAAFRQAARREESLPALLGLGESYAGRGDWARALEAWYQALALAPDDPLVHVALARGNVSQGRFERAREALSRALALAPAPDLATEAHALLGRLLAGDGPAGGVAYDPARDQLRQAGDEEMLAVLEAAAEEPVPARRELLLGAAFLRKDELSLAKRHFSRAVTLEPTSAEALAYLGRAMDRLGETVQGREMLEQALALDPEAPLVYYFLGVHHREVGNVEHAQEVLWEGLQRDPENAALRAEMARTFEELSQYDRAEEWYQGAVEVAPGDAGFALILAQFYTDHVYRIREAGLAAARDAVALAPLEPGAHDLLGWAYCLAGSPAQGEQALLQALALDPDLVSAHFHLGSLYARTGRADLAHYHLQRAADLDTTGYYRERALLLSNEVP